MTIFAGVHDVPEEGEDEDGEEPGSERVSERASSRRRTPKGQSACGAQLTDGGVGTLHSLGLQYSGCYRS